MPERKKVIVTGGLGYIGSHTCVELSNSGYDIVIIDDLCNSQASVLNAVRDLCNTEIYWEEVDLKDRNKTLAVFDKYDDIEGLIHFAAYKAVGESVRDPLKYYDNNINSLLNVLAAHQEQGLNKLIFSSSCTVYGLTDELPVTEKTAIGKAFSPYGYTKQICESILSDFTQAHKDMKAISLRYFNPIGAHPSTKIGELPLGEPENLMPYITQTAAGIRDELKVFGSDYNTPDGTAIRDYIHVVDLAKAHVIALDRLIHRKSLEPHEFFNLGTGKGYSVLEVIHSFEKVSGRKLKYRLTDRRPGDLEAIYANTDLSKKVLGWEAHYSLDDMTLSAWNWEKKIRNLND